MKRGTEMSKYDTRIARIMEKINALRDREFTTSCGEWPPVWNPPLSEKQVSDFERGKGIRLPEDYRRFITTLDARRSPPNYGLERPLQQKDAHPEKPFPYHQNEILYFLFMTEEEMDRYYNDESHDGGEGLLWLATEGCGMDSVLVVNSPDPETYGTVWYFDLANDCGIIPMRDKKTGKPFQFLDWLEYFADRTAELGDDEYFGYAETAWIPDPPENPEIMGRKMGWIK